MKDKVFIDTNIFVYAFLDSELNPENGESHAKHLKAVDFLKKFHSNSEVIISTQVLSEILQRLVKKQN
jgi:predicted nucleic acid-binding protein